MTAEQHDEWIEGRRYLGLDVLARSRGDNTATTMRALLGAQLKPVPVSPGLMVYLDQVKRARLIARWNEVLRAQ